MISVGNLFHFKNDHWTYSIKPEYYATKPLFVATADSRLLEFFLNVLDDPHTCKSLGTLQFTSAEPKFDKDIAKRLNPAIPATPTAEEMPAYRAFSRQLVTYIAVFLPVAPFFRASNSRIAGVCNDQYSSTLETLCRSPSAAPRTAGGRGGGTAGGGGCRVGSARASPAPDPCLGLAGQVILELLIVGVFPARRPARHPAPVAAGSVGRRGNRRCHPRRAAGSDRRWCCGGADLTRRGRQRRAGR